MKLRALALLLLLANLGFFAWTQGWLDAVVGARAQGEREPGRLASQYQPQIVRVLAAGEAAAAMAAAGGGSCLEAGPYAGPDASLAESILETALPAGSWVRRNADRSGAWLVYLGRFASAEALQKKAAELRLQDMPVEELQSPPELVPGLSLGRFDNRAAADTAFEQLAQRGVRAARVVTLAEPAPMASLRVEHADAALIARISAIDKPVRGEPLGRAFVTCAK